MESHKSRSSSGEGKLETWKQREEPPGREPGEVSAGHATQPVPGCGYAGAVERFYSAFKRKGGLEQGLNLGAGEVVVNELVRHETIEQEKRAGSSQPCDSLRVAGTCKRVNAMQAAKIEEQGIARLQPKRVEIGHIANEKAYLPSK